MTKEKLQKIVEELEKQLQKFRPYTLAKRAGEEAKISAEIARLKIIERAFEKGEELGGKLIKLREQLREISQLQYDDAKEIEEVTKISDEIKRVGKILKGCTAIMLTNGTCWKCEKRIEEKRLLAIIGATDDEPRCINCTE